ncbi:MAG TPA: AraC family transcriptional regulator [Burkholderiaceae bacterium]|nr:AraC family transcriptional regulator [Burkholderiaceae bacterium]
MAVVSELDEIRTLIRRHVGRAQPLPGITLRSATAATEFSNTLAEPVFAVVAQGAKRTILGDKVFEYGAGQFLVVSVDLPISGQVVRATAQKPYLSVGMTLKPATIAGLLLEAGNSAKMPLEPTGLAVCDAPPELLDPILRLLRLLDRPQDISVLTPLLEREILWRLLNGEQGWMVRQIGLVDSSLSQIARAIRWIRAHFNENFRIEDPAGEANMSAATFYRHFRAVTAMSPLQYQKRIRLQNARARLMANSRDVASVGFAVGYESPSQFSREYSRMFGAPPGEDAARLKAGALLESSAA